MRLTISRKLFGGFAIVLCLLVMVSVISIAKMSGMGREADSIENKWMPSVKTLADMQADMYAIQHTLMSMVMESDDYQMKSYQSQLNDSIAELKTIQKKYESDYVSNEDESKIIHQFMEAEEQYLKVFPEVIQARKNYDLVTANFLISQSFPKFEQAMKGLDELIALNDSGSNRATGNSLRTVQSGRWFVISVSLVAIAAGIGMAYWISVMISKPLAAVTSAVKRMADGDLTMQYLDIRSNDEIGNLGKSFNLMKASMRELLYQIGTHSELVAASSQQLTASADHTSAASGHVAQHAQEVAEAVSQQVERLEESKRTIEEMLEGIRQIAASADQSSAAVSETNRLSLSGNEVVQTSMKQMESIYKSTQDQVNAVKRLSEQSRQIGSIIGTITELSSDTNLLALNASIEAARAGEHGKGFAVVAYQVRKLAEQSAASAKEISKLISSIQNETNNAKACMEQSAQEVTEGMRIIHEAGQSFYQIQTAIESVEMQTGEVTAAVNQMAAGADRIVHSFGKLKQLAEQSAVSTQGVSSVAEEQLASMEEINASSAALSGMASELQCLVNRFKL